MIMLKNIEDINSLINYQENPYIKEINALKMNSSNFSKVIDNFWIIKRFIWRRKQKHLIHSKMAKDVETKSSVMNW